MYLTFRTDCVVWVVLVFVRYFTVQLVLLVFCLFCLLRFFIVISYMGHLLA